MIKQNKIKEEKYIGILKSMDFMSKSIGMIICWKKSPEYHAKKLMEQHLECNMPNIIVVKSAYCIYVPILSDKAAKKELGN